MNLAVFFKQTRIEAMLPPNVIRAIENEFLLKRTLQTGSKLVEYKINAHRLNDQNSIQSRMTFFGQHETPGITGRTSCNGDEHCLGGHHNVESRTLMQLE